MRTCAVCGKTDKESKSGIAAFGYFLQVILKDKQSLLKKPGGCFAHPRCISKIQLKLRKGFDKKEK